MEVHYFDRELEKGDKGEILIAKTYPYIKLQHCDGHDALCREITTVEIKTDYWYMKQTENFFMEAFSNDINYKLGGPYRAEIWETNVFLYQFYNDKVIFWFDDIPRLVRTIDSYVAQNGLEWSEIRNKGYNTLGYKIPRIALAHLYKQINLGDELP